MMKSSLLVAALALTPALASAQVSQSGYVLPLDLALEAAQEAVRTCAANGYAVTATVVDVDGTPKVVLRGDHSTIHTRDSSFRKAYTVITMGPIFHLDTSGGFTELVAKNPAGAQLTTMPNVVALPGAVAIKAGAETVAALGVGGAPGGEKDEVCAAAGVARIRDRLPK
jgi:uncharacterized protein GlcG (DUF336 family)